MPAAAGLLAGCRPPAALPPPGGRFRREEPGGPADLPARDADVAADALADVVEPALVDLHREERVGDGRAAGGDDVKCAVVDRLDHEVGAGEPADAEHRLLRDALDRLLPREQA